MAVFRAATSASVTLNRAAAAAAAAPAFAAATSADDGDGGGACGGDGVRAVAGGDAACSQGLTLVHFSAQRKRFLWDRGRV
jgi:hypothetical protein